MRNTGWAWEGQGLAHEQNQSEIVAVASSQLFPIRTFLKRRFAATPVHRLHLCGV